MPGNQPRSSRTPAIAPPSHVSLALSFCGPPPSTSTFIASCVRLASPLSKGSVRHLHLAPRCRRYSDILVPSNIQHSLSNSCILRCPPPPDCLCLFLLLASAQLSQGVCTIFSAPNYCYRCGNQAAIMEVDETVPKQISEALYDHCNL